MSAIALTAKATAAPASTLITSWVWNVLREGPFADHRFNVTGLHPVVFWEGHGSRKSPLLAGTERGGFARFEDRRGGKGRCVRNVLIEPWLICYIMRASAIRPHGRGAGKEIVMATKTAGGALLPIRIGIDLGGSKIEIIAMDDSGRELLRRRLRTPQDRVETKLLPARHGDSSGVRGAARLW